MSTSIDKTMDKFPHHTLDPIVGQPNFKTLLALHLNLNTNASSIHSHLGNGRSGLLFLTVTPQVYNTQSAVAFIPPVNPGATPVVPPASTVPQINKVHHQFNRDTLVYNEYVNTDKTLKGPLIVAADESYIQALWYKYIGYTNVSTLEMPTHLYDNYAKITPTYLENNDKKMMED